MTIEGEPCTKQKRCKKKQCTNLQPKKSLKVDIDIGFDISRSSNTYLCIANVLRSVCDSPFEGPKLSVKHVDVVFAEKLDGVFLGKADGAILQRREDSRRHVDVISEKSSVGEKTFGQ